MLIAVDIDSTLHHYWDQLAGAARRRFGIELPYGEQTGWEIEALSEGQLATCVGETHSDEVILSSEPYPGAVETIAAWRAAGHEIHVTSHRLDAARGATARWLEEIGLPYDELHCSFDKVAYCVARSVGLLVDDSPVNLARARAAGIAAATIAHPWNRSLCGRDGILCAEDWPALGRVLAPVLGDDAA